MATGFKAVSYTTDAGTVVRIRMSKQAQDIAGQGGLTAAIDDPNIFAYASNPGSKAKKQLNARGIILTRTVGTAPDTFQRRTFVPITTLAALNAITLNSAITGYGGNNYTVAEKIAEA